MALDPQIKKMWQEVQAANTVPVNTIGMPINPKDQNSMRVWMREGIDKFQKS